MFENLFYAAAGWGLGMMSYRYMLTTSWGKDWIETKAKQIADLKAKAAAVGKSK